MTGRAARRLLRAGSWGGAGGAPLWPTQATTGYRNAPYYPGSLADGSALTVTSNTAYRFYNFPSGVVVPANVVNVVFYGCQFLSSGGVGTIAAALNNGGNNGITFSYCTFAPQNLSTSPTLSQSYQFAINAPGTGALTADHCNISGYGNAIYSDGGSQAHPHVYQYNYIHDPCQDPTYHTDGIGLPGGGTESYTVILGNNLQALGNTNGLAYQIVASGGGSSSWSNFTITGNLFGGYGYTIQLLDGTTVSPAAPSAITFTGNTFSTLLECTTGPLYDNSFIAQPHWTWRNNRWMVPPGAWWGHSQYSGYYWLPGFTSNAGPSLDELAAGLVSTSDYTG